VSDSVKGRLMSPADRRRLIERPMPAIRLTHATGKSWGGTYLADHMPTEGRRVPHGHADDEQFYAVHGRE
jgi:hypothetical protein